MVVGRPRVRLSVWFRYRIVAIACGDATWKTWNTRTMLFLDMFNIWPFASTCKVLIIQKATCYARSSERCRHQKAGIRTMIGKHVVRVWFGGWAPIYVCLEGFQFVLAWPTKSVPTHTPSMFLLACSPNQMSQVPKWHEQQIPSKKTNSRENASGTNQWTTI